MSPDALLDRLSRDGVSVKLDGNDVCLAVEPPRTIDQGLIAEVRALKADVVAELRRRSQTATDGEWEIRGCPGFTVLTTANDSAEMRFGACLRCGSSWPMHGSPDINKWSRVADLDEVVPAAIRFVLSRAREIARGHA